MVSELVLITFFVTSLQLMVPILLASLGEILVERSGVLNVGIEGVMLIGAFATALVGIESGSVWLALLAGFGSGLLCGALLSSLYVRIGADQVVTGLMFNILAVGLTSLLRDQLIGGQVGPTLRGISIPVVERIRFAGDVLAQQNVLLWASVAMTAVLTVALYRTWWGLHVRAAGERPDALAASGHDVWRTRYPAVTIGCGLSALGGTALVLSSSGGFVPDMVAGRGFIALGVVVLARWRPWIALLGAAGFGLAQSLQFLASQIDALAGIPEELWLAAPYAAVIVAAVFSLQSRYPGAVGIPYKPSTASELRTASRFWTRLQ